MTTMTTKIDMDNVLPLLEAAVETRGGGYVYRKDHDACRYTLDGETPACLIGVLIHQLGVPLTRDMARYSGGIYTAYRGGWFRGLVIEDSALHVLSVAQSKQDGGGTWGEALASARAEHSLLASADGA